MLAYLTTKEGVMTKSQNIDLTIWNKEYDTKVKNLEGIFIKVEKVLDVSLAHFTTETSNKRLILCFLHKIIRT